MKLVVLGAGPGGYVAALRAAQLGAAVTVVEHEEVGGTCLNWGCIPTKAIRASTEALHQARVLDDFGIKVEGTVHPDIKAIIERKNKVVSTQIKGIRSLFKSWGVTLLQGRGSLARAGVVAVEKKDGTREEIPADKIIIATGSRPAPFAAAPFDGKRVLSSNDAIHLAEIPKTLIIIGAGVIGCEFASIFGEMGSEVTMLELLPRAVATEDTEISEVLEREFKKRKIKLRTGVKVTAVDTAGDGVNVTLDNGEKLTAERLLVSIGRALNTEGLGLEAAGVKFGPRGAIAVDQSMQTNVPGIYAIGDVVGGMLLAHKASREGMVAASNACGVPAVMRYDVIPAAVFTRPEIGSVGLREHQAAEKGIAIKTGSFPFRALGKAHAIGEIAGVVKIVADAATDKVLGVHVIGAHAADLVHEGALAIQAGLTTEQVAAMIHAHPTLSEGVMEAAEALHGRAIHMAKQ